MIITIKSVEELEKYKKIHTTEDKTLNAWPTQKEGGEHPTPGLELLKPGSTVDVEVKSTKSGDYTYANITSVKAAPLVVGKAAPQALPIAATHSNGETMTKADWEKKDRRVVRVAIAKSIIEAINDFPEPLANQAFAWVMEEQAPISPPTQSASKPVTTTDSLKDRIIAEAKELGLTGLQVNICLGESITEWLIAGKTAEAAIAALQQAAKQMAALQQAAKQMEKP